MKTIARTQIDLDGASIPLGVNSHDLNLAIKDARTAYPFVLLWLTNNGFKMKSDGRSGWLLEKDQKTYRLRALSQNVEFNSAKTRGVGRCYIENAEATWENECDGILVFDVQEMPNTSVVLVSMDEVGELKRRFPKGSLSRVQWFDELNREPVLI